MTAKRLSIASSMLISLFTMNSYASDFTISITNSFTNPISITSIKQNKAELLDEPTSIAALSNSNFKLIGNDVSDNQFEIQLENMSRQLTLDITEADGAINATLSGDCDSNGIHKLCNLDLKADDKVNRFNPEIASIHSEVDAKLSSANLSVMLNPTHKGPELNNDASKISVLSYNVWGTKIYGSKKENERFNAIPENVAGYDILALTEAIDQKATTNILLPKLAPEYPYATKNYHNLFFDHLPRVVGSGLRIVSKYPIVREDIHYFHRCDGLQCFASKGVVYAKVDKLGQIYHIFLSHTQSGTSFDAKNDRLAQIKEIKDFIDSKNIPDNEPVIVAGDLNIDKINMPDEYDTMQTSLNTQVPPMSGWEYSYDPHHNHWAKGDNEYLDYVLPINDHLIPLKSFNRVLSLRSTNDDLWGVWDLSDHYAVAATFEYALNPHPTR
ncbi:sphingomyelin phosphodiesterase [Shewanella sp. 202IG2-18]|uniref:sphingomyelin phosphodiesterase n=1 Tax=Parashewanella hymeniacidonis TaxID=2807618 RepID=UPI00195FF9EA|nr:sphingomyelin phosphodiesterase [Parashewanella hymeniacidonis]MBM7071437.1 sphingomyelin phosphodiesterase [Parashewanella hymeniacidonis]